MNRKLFSPWKWVIPTSTQWWSSNTPTPSTSPLLAWSLSIGLGQMDMDDIGEGYEWAVMIWVWVWASIGVLKPSPLTGICLPLASVGPFHRKLLILSIFLNTHFLTANTSRPLRWVNCPAWFRRHPAVSFQMVIILYGVLFHVKLRYSLNFTPQWYCYRILCIDWFFSPSVQTGYAVSTANVLLQAVEVALPKQKKAQAVSEFKHSIIAHKRRARVQQNSGTWYVPFPWCNCINVTLFSVNLISWAHLVLEHIWWLGNYCTSCVFYSVLQYHRCTQGPFY